MLPLRCVRNILLKYVIVVTSCAPAFERSQTNRYIQHTYTKKTKAERKRETERVRGREREIKEREAVRKKQREVCILHMFSFI